MKMKPVLAALAATVLGFLLGWLIFGLLLSSFYMSNMTVYEGLMIDPPPIWIYIIGNLALSILFVYIFHFLACVKTFGKGFVAGLIISFLIMFTFDLYFFGTMNLFTFPVAIVDVIANTIVGALMAGVAAWILGMGEKPATTE